MPKPAAAPTAASVSPGLTGAITVFAAASLTEAFGDFKESLKASSPGLSVTYSFSGSGTLAPRFARALRPT